MVGIYTVGSSTDHGALLAAAAQAGTQIIIVDDYCTMSMQACTYAVKAYAAELEAFDRLCQDDGRDNWKAVERSHNFHQSKWSHNRPKNR